MSESDDEFMQRLDEDSRRKSEAVKHLLIQHGRPDLAKDLDRRLKDIRTGLDGARSTWHSISAAQRRVLEIMEPGRVLMMPPHTKTRYNAIGLPCAIGDVCSLATVRALLAHELVACDGGVFTPERKIVLTERGHFTLKYGRPDSPLGSESR